MSMSMGSQAAANDREQRGYRWLWPGVAAFSIVAAPLGGAVMISGQQEQPRQVPSRLIAGVQGPNVAASALSSAQFVRGTHASALERDRQGQAFLRSGVPPTAAAQAPALPGIIYAAVREQPNHPSSILLSHGPVAGVAFRRQALITRQEQPGSIASQLFAGVAPSPPITSASERRAVITSQEQPRHAGSIFVAGPPLTPAVFSSPERRDLITRQQMPDHPSSVMVAGVPGPDVAGPSVASAAKFVTSLHAESLWRDRRGQVWLWQGVIAAAIPPGPLLRADRIATVQERPSHPSSSFNAGVPGPDVAAPVVSTERRTLITRQERPDHPSSVLLAGVPGPDVTRTTGTPAFVKGTQSASLERDLRGSAWLWHQNFTAAPPPVSAGQDRIATTQERPDHPLPFLSSGTANYGYSVPNITILLQDGYGQEQPPAPVLVMRPGVPPVPVFIPPGTRGFVTKQEPPWHPGSRFWPGLPPVPTFIDLGTHQVLTRQEPPWHPSSLLWAGNHPFLLVQTPEPRAFIGAQEQPWHPVSIFWPGSVLSVDNFEPKSRIFIGRASGARYTGRQSMTVVHEPYPGRRGDTWQIEGLLYYFDGTPFNLGNGATVNWIVKDGSSEPDGGNVLLSLSLGNGITVIDEAGKILIRVTPTQSAAFALGEYPDQLRAVDPSGFTAIEWVGTVKVRRSFFIP